jgi:hypothetical protein
MKRTLTFLAAASLSPSMANAAEPAAGEQVEASFETSAGTKLRFTTLKHIGHNSWSAAYATPELYQWFDGHLRRD